MNPSTPTKQTTAGPARRGRPKGTAARAAGSAAVDTQRLRRPYQHRGQFTRDISRLMYAFGDVENPDPASIAVLEEMTVEFLTDLCHRARPSPHALALPVMFPTILPDEATASSSSAAAPPRLAPHPYAARHRLKVDDVKMALRKDAKKLGRIEELIYLDKVITGARKAFVEPEAEEAQAEQANVQAQAQRQRNQVAENASERRGALALPRGAGAQQQQQQGRGDSMDSS